MRGNDQSSKTVNRYSLPGGIWVLWIFLIIFTAGFLIGIINCINLSFKYTYAESCSPGTLVSERYDKYWITLALVMMLRFLFIGITTWRISSRGSAFALNVHFIMFIVWLISEVAFAVVWGLELRDCNKATAEGNRCNDYRWCGVYAANSTYCPKNYCGMNATLGSCAVNATFTNWTTPVVRDVLSHNDDYDWAFGLSLAMLFVGFCIGALSYFYRTRSQFDEDEVEFIGGAMPHQVAPSTTNNSNSVKLDPYTVDFNVAAYLNQSKDHTL